MNTDLIKLRDKITKLDYEILKTLEKRMHFSREIAKFKKQKNILIEDKGKEKELISDRKAYTFLDKGFVEKLFNLIFKESKKTQKIQNEHY